MEDFPSRSSQEMIDNDNDGDDDNNVSVLCPLAEEQKLTQDVQSLSDPWPSDTIITQDRFRSASEGSSDESQDHGSSDACDNCRDRGIICNEVRPSCNNCAADGYVCEYTSEYSSSNWKRQILTPGSNCEGIVLG